METPYCFPAFSRSRSACSIKLARSTDFTDLASSVQSPACMSPRSLSTACATRRASTLCSRRYATTALSHLVPACLFLFIASLPCSMSNASLAITPSPGPTNVCRDQSMPFTASPVSLRVARLQRSPVVLCLRDRLKMPGHNTKDIPAQVVDVQPFGYGTSTRFVNYAVDLPGAPVVGTYSAVPRSSLSPCPYKRVRFEFCIFQRPFPCGLSRRHSCPPNNKRAAQLGRPLSRGS